MLNLIKLMVAMAIASFSVNASAFVMGDDHDGYSDGMSSPSYAEHRAEEKNTAREHRREHRSSENKVSRKHLRSEKKAAKKHARQEKRAARKEVVERKVQRLFAQLRKIVADNPGFFEGDNDFDSEGMDSDRDSHNGKGGMRQLEYIFANMDRHDYSPKKPGHDSQPDNNHDVPEPGIVGLLALGLLGMAVRRRFKA